VAGENYVLRRTIIVLFTKHYSDNQIKKDEMSGLLES
jgi:hypothetical protein